MQGKPRALQHGKKAVNFFAAYKDFIQPLWVLGASAMCIQTHCFDKLLYNLMMRLVRGHYARLYGDRVRGGVLSLQHREEYCMEWCIGMRCRLHGASKSIEWALREFADEDRRSDAHIGMASLMNTSVDIHRNAEPFLFRVLSFDGATACRENNKHFLESLFSHMGNR